tara:strand:+ start:58 stop:636 length:579 start_codon:yes stop_codon:yes gene_type:complete
MDDGLKQRLIGALVLVAIAIIFLPSLFSGEQGRRLNTRTQIPSVPEVKPLIIKAPMRVPNMPKAPEPEDMYRLLEEDKPVDMARNKDQVNSKTKVKNNTVPVPVPPALDARAIPKAWAIQVASFNTRSPAEILSTRLKKDGYKAFVHSVVIAKGRVYRVLVGPKIDRLKAQLTKDELDAELKVNSILVKFQP